MATKYFRSNELPAYTTAASGHVNGRAFGATVIAFWEEIAPDAGHLQLKECPVGRTSRRSILRLMDQVPWRRAVHASPHPGHAQNTARRAVGRHDVRRHTRLLKPQANETYVKCVGPKMRARRAMLALENGSVANLAA